MFARTSKHVPSYQQYWQVGTSVAWADKEGGSNSSNSDYALFGAPGCFTWRGNLYGRQPGGLRRKSAMLLVWFFDHRLAGSIRESQAGLGESNFLRWALDPTQRFSISTLVGKNTAILVLQSHREPSMMERCWELKQEYLLRIAIVSLNAECFLIWCS